MTGRDRILLALLEEVRGCPHYARGCACPDCLKKEAAVRYAWFRKHLTFWDGCPCRLCVLLEGERRLLEERTKKKSGAVA